MTVEKGVIIVAYKPRSPPRYLVLKRKKNWEGWELPKGHLEQGDFRETVKTELEEESGIGENQIKEVEELDQWVEWSYENDNGEKVERKYKGFMVKVSEDSHVDVTGNPHEEHEDGFFFRYRDVEKMLTYEDQAELLEAARESIKE